MKLTRVVLAVALVPLLGLLSCGQAGQQEGMEMGAMDMEALAADMAELSADWVQAYEAGDAAALASLYADDAIYLAPYNEAVRGRAAIQTRFAEVIGTTTERHVTVERADAGGSGDLAYGIGSYSVELGMAGAETPVTDRGKYITIAKRGEDGAFRIYAHIWNTSLPESEVMQMLSTMSEMSAMSEMDNM